MHAVRKLFFYAHFLLKNKQTNPKSIITWQTLFSKILNTKQAVLNKNKKMYSSEYQNISIFKTL